MLREFNLSRNKSLRTLETTAESIKQAGDTASFLLKTVLFSITSPTPLDLVIIYRNTDLDGIQYNSRGFERVSIDNSWSEETDYEVRQQLRMLRKIQAVRGFRLVLCADVSDCMVEYAVEKLKRIVKVEKVTRGLGHLPYKPLIIAERRTIHTRSSDTRVGSLKCSGRMLASAL